MKLKPETTDLVKYLKRELDAQSQNAEYYRATRNTLAYIAGYYGYGSADSLLADHAFHLTPITDRDPIDAVEAYRG